MSNTIKSKCSCGKEFYISLSGNPGRADGKRVYPADTPDTGWCQFRCPDCGELVADSVPGAEYEKIGEKHDNTR